MSPWRVVLYEGARKRGNRAVLFHVPVPRRLMARGEGHMKPPAGQGYPGAIGAQQAAVYIPAGVQQ